MDIGGRKMAGFASGCIDSFQYFGGALAGALLGSIVERHWDNYFYFMAPFGAIGALLMLTLRFLPPRAAETRRSRAHTRGRVAGRSLTRDTLMRRYVFVILFFIVLVTPFVLRSAIGTTSPQAAAPGAGGEPLKLVIVTAARRGHPPGSSPTRFPCGTRRTTVGRSTSTGATTAGAAQIVKFFDTSRVAFDTFGNYGVDLVWGGGDAVFDDQLKKGGPPPARQPAAGGDAPRVPARGARRASPLRRRLAAAVVGDGAVEFRHRVQPRRRRLTLGLPEPRTWRDLADPRYRGWIVMADPTLSSSAKSAYMIIVERAMA
jgi:hypothetical protein